MTEMMTGIRSVPTAPCVGPGVGGGKSKSEIADGYHVDSAGGGDAGKIVRTRDINVTGLCQGSVY